ncbi:hypothetical protein D3C73_1103710 [compost metagenome]
MQGVFQCQQGRGCGVFRAQRDAEGQGYTGQRGMHTALEHADPEDQANDHVGPELDHAEPVHPDQRRDAGGGQCQGQGRQFAGIENRDDDDRAEVVDDRQGHQEQLQRHRHAFAQQRQYAQREGDVGGGRDRPAVQGRWVVTVEEPVDQRRHHHAANGGRAGQDDLRRFGQLPVEDLALDLQPDQQEEQRHEPVVDPQQQRLGDFQRADLGDHGGFQQAVVEPRQWGVVDDQREDSRGDQ